MQWWHKMAWIYELSCLTKLPFIATSGSYLFYFLFGVEWGKRHFSSSKTYGSSGGRTLIECRGSGPPVGQQEEALSDSRGSQHVPYVSKPAGGKLQVDFKLLWKDLKIKTVLRKHPKTICFWTKCYLFCSDSLQIRHLGFKHNLKDEPKRLIPI